MADCGGAISISQAQNSSSDGSSQHSPRSQPAISTPLTQTGSASGSSSKHSDDKILEVGTHHPITILTANNPERRPRGRPPGSRNKPKPPVILTRESDPTMKPIILEISAGADVVESIVNFARRNHLSISIMSASGAVSSVTLRHFNSHAPLISLHGPLGLLSLSGSFHGGGSNCGSSGSFSATFGGTQGQVFGGTVGGPMTAASPVVVVGSTFVNHLYYRLPPLSDRPHPHPDEGENRESKIAKVGGGGGASGGDYHSGAGTSMAVYGVANPTPLNSCQLAADGSVMQWGPPRPPF